MKKASAVPQNQEPGREGWATEAVRKIQHVNIEDAVIQKLQSRRENSLLRQREVGVVPFETREYGRSSPFVALVKLNNIDRDLSL